MVLRYGFNRDGQSSFDVRGPRALMYCICGTSNRLLAGCIYVTPTLTEPGTTARLYEGDLPGLLAVYRLSPSRLQAQ